MGYMDYVRHGLKVVHKRGQLPVYLVYFISDICNAKCKHCLLADGAHPNWEKPSLALTKQQLSLEEIDKVSASLGKGSLMFLLPTGGEPFLRKDIGEVIKIFHKNTGVPNVGIPTNGSMTARTVSIVTDVLKSCPGLDLHIDVSLDGVGEDHDELRVMPGLFDKSIATYKALRELEKHYKNFSVQVETTVSSYNDQKLVENYDWFRENLDVDTVFTLLTRGKPKEPAAKFFDVAKYEEYAKLMERDYKNGSLSGYDSFPLADVINAKRIVRHKLIAEIVRTNKYQTPCYAGNLGACLFANGDTYPCELLTDRKLGNVRDVGYDFKKIWFSPKADAARTFIRDSKCFCTYECFLTINILFNPRMLLSVAKEWAILKARRYGRRLFGRQTAQTTTKTHVAGAQPAQIPAIGATHLQPPPRESAAKVGAQMARGLMSLPVLDPEVGLDPHAECCQHADAVSKNS
jgi:MoaA/NifB/PqqE/SkfB family radical SAM enzyme